LLTLLEIGSALMLVGMTMGMIPQITNVELSNGEEALIKVPPFGL
jgi:hypothetical protein